LGIGTSGPWLHPRFNDKVASPSFVEILKNLYEFSLQIDVADRALTFDREMLSNADVEPFELPVNCGPFKPIDFSASQAGDGSEQKSFVRIGLRFRKGQSGPPAPAS
jgi:hypothetical protein